MRATVACSPGCPVCGPPFRAADAAARGLSVDALRGPRVRRLHTGVYVCAGIRVTPLVRAAGALLLLPDDAAVSHVTGLQLRGLSLGRSTILHFSSTHPHQVRLPGVRVHRRRTLPPHRGRLLAVESCFVEAAAQLGPVDAVAAGDWLLHARRTDLRRLRRAVEDAAGRRGVQPARTALERVRSGAESPRETRLRLVLVLAGLPEPLLNRDLCSDGRFIARADMVYPAYRVVVEYDGRQHAEDVRQWNRDIERHEALAAAGWEVYRVTAARMRDPREVVRRVHAMLVAAGYRGPAPRFDAQWRRLFEPSAG